MTIDSTLLRTHDEGGISEVVLRSQLLRLGESHEDDQRKKIQRWQQMDAEKRKCLRELNSQRRLLKTLRNDLAPCNNNLYSAIEKEEKKKQIRCMKLGAIPQLQERLTLLTLQLENELIQFSNIIDESNYDMNLKVKLPICDCTVNEVNIDVSDILFCLGGYEKLSIPQVSIADNSRVRTLTTVVLSDVGSLLASAVYEFSKDFLMTKLEFRIKRMIHLPNIKVPTEIVQAALGCPAGEAIDEVPSYIPIALLKANKIYSEKELPELVLCQSESDSIMQGKHDFAHKIFHLEFFSLTISDIIYSRRLQDDIANHLVQLYSSMLCTSKHFDCNTIELSSRSTPPLKFTSADPSQLDSNEVRRITIYGYISSRKEYVSLGFVSNTTDYISRSMKIKCGGNQIVEFVHVLRGVSCSYNIIEWILDQNLARIRQNATDSSYKDGVVIPASLTHFMSYPFNRCAAAFFPFKRVIGKGKNSKAIIEDVLGVTDPIPLYSLDLEKQEFSNQSRREIRMLDDTKRSHNDTIAESYCNPYDFLPFVFKYTS